MISVCLASYNGERYIKKQILSILSQLSSDDELIVSDDHSTDGTLGILSAINDHRLKVYSNNLISAKKHRYANAHYRVAKNFENALSHATGDYIFFSDQDDIWLPNKVELTLSALQRYELVMSNYAVIDENGRMVKTEFYSTSPIYRSCLLNLIRLPFHGCCMAFRKEILDYSMPFPIELIAHDNWIGMCSCIKKCKIGYINRPLIQYRRHQFNVSPLKKNNLNPLWFKIWYRAVLTFQLLKTM